MTVCWYCSLASIAASEAKIEFDRIEESEESEDEEACSSDVEYSSCWLNAT